MLPPRDGHYQLAYMLTHAAILADTKVRHYPLVETFDAWESWDVIHSAPSDCDGASRAYSHAGVKTSNGLKMPVGTYISWANQGERLLDDSDVRFLADTINAAVADAKQTTAIYGPTLVYSRESMQWQADHATPNHDINEWIDEQMGSVIKWPMPVLSATRLEWLPTVKSDLFVLQTPSHFSDGQLKSIQQLIGSGQPVAMVGSFPDGIGPILLALAGLQTTSAPVETPRLCKAKNEAPDVVANAPATFDDYCHPWAGSVIPEITKTIYSEDGMPALVSRTSGANRIAAWNPPDLRSLEGKPLSQVWGNTGSPYALAAGVLTDMLSANSALHAGKIDLKQTMNVAAWQTRDGGFRILAGNLEEGLRDDADPNRSAAHC